MKYLRLHKGDTFDTLEGKATVTDYNGSIFYIDLEKTVYEEDADGNTLYDKETIVTEEVRWTPEEVMHEIKDKTGLVYKVVFETDDDVELYKIEDNAMVYYIVENRDTDKFITIDWDLSEDEEVELIKNFENGTLDYKANGKEWLDIPDDYYKDFGLFNKKFLSLR